jgi:hypothetical protein
MSLRSFKNWLSDRFTDSLTQPQEIYPRNAVNGLLYTAGFNSSNARIMIDRPVGTENIIDKALIIISVPASRQTQKTGQGAYGQVVNERYVEIDLFWVADFTTPVYVSKVVSDTAFDNLITSVEKTLSLSIYNMEAATNSITSRNWQITDAAYGASFIKGEEPLIGTIVTNPDKTEAGSPNILYQARLTAIYKELYTSALPGT